MHAAPVATTIKQYTKRRCLRFSVEHFIEQQNRSIQQPFRILYHQFHPVCATTRIVNPYNVKCRPTRPDTHPIRSDKRSYQPACCMYHPRGLTSRPSLLKSLCLLYKQYPFLASPPSSPLHSHLPATGGLPLYLVTSAVPHSVAASRRLHPQWLTPSHRLTYPTVPTCHHMTSPSAKRLVQHRTRSWELTNS